MLQSQHAIGRHHATIKENKLILFAEKMFKILIRFGCFLPTKKQNNAACSAEKSASKVQDSWIKIDFALASHNTNHA